MEDKVKRKEKGAKGKEPYQGTGRRKRSRRGIKKASISKITPEKKKNKREDAVQRPPIPVLGLVPGSDGSSLGMIPTLGSGIWISRDI